MEEPSKRHGEWADPNEMVSAEGGENEVEDECENARYREADENHEVGFFDGLALSFQDGVEKTNHVHEDGGKVISTVVDVEPIAAEVDDIAGNSVKLDGLIE